MFQQNPHPLYKALLTYNYTFQKSESTDWYDLVCHDQKLTVRLNNGTLYILDPDKGMTSNFPWLDIFDSKDKDIHHNIFKAIDEYIILVKESLKPENIEIMNFIIYEITQKYPDIKIITFLDGPTSIKKSTRFVDQNNYYYEIKGSNIPEFITYFSFIDNIELSFTQFLKKTSNHVMLENTEKYLKYKKKFNINISINKI